MPSQHLPELDSDADAVADPEPVEEPVAGLEPELELLPLPVAVAEAAKPNRNYTKADLRHLCPPITYQS